jgi:hypothetical protein
MITIKSKNTEVLQSSLQFVSGNTAVSYQANTDLYVEGNTYEDLKTQKTIFNLVCPVADVANILTVTQTQIDEYITINYPPIK